MYKQIIKRIIDVILSVTAVIALLPLMIFTALMIKIEGGGPVIFSQKRVGIGGIFFKILKFRSMAMSSIDIPSAHARELQITKVGKIIRRTNIDELPQLFNIIKGEMSIVGPRPALSSQKELVALRMENGSIQCRPGLTGLAQVNSYNGMSDLEKARWDGEYSNKVSFLNDMYIVIRTFGYIIRKPPVY